MRLFSIFITVILFLSNQSYSQIKLIKRLEYDKEEEGYGYIFYGMKEEGGVMTYLTHEKKSAKYTRHFEKMNNKLTVEKSSSYSKPDYLNYSERDYNDKFIYYMDYSVKEEQYKIHTIQKSTLKIKSISGKLPKKCSVSDISIVNDKLFVRISPKKEDSYIRIIDPQTGIERTLNYPEMKEHKKRAYIGYNIVGKEEKAEFHIKYETRPKKGENKYYIFRYNSEGKLINGKPMILDVGPEKEIYHIRLTPDKEGSGGYLMAGTYSNKKRLPEGLFTGRITKNGQVKTYSLHNFLDMEHFTDFLSERRQDKIEEKRDKAESKGKEYNYTGRAALHNIYYHEDRNYLVTEFYYPTYRTEYYYVTVDGKSVRRSRKVFDGYQYTHALIAKIDNDGKILWTNIFEMWLAHKPMSVKRYIRKSIDEDNNLELSYANGSGLRFMTFTDKGKILKERKFNYIETGKADDQVKYTAGSHVMYWYDNYYIVSGRQKIKDTDKGKGDKKKRYVYFFNMIKY